MKSIPMALAISAAVALLAGCTESTKPSAPAQPPATVDVANVVSESLPMTVSLLGELKSSATVYIKSKVSGYVVIKSIADGQRVKQGDVLYEIDDTDFALQVDKARAQGQVAKASLDLADTEFKRIAHLRANKAVSQQDFDSAKAARAIRLSEYQATQANLKQAQQAQADTRITAPFEGVVREGQVNVGDMVQGQATTLITLSKVNPLWVEVGLSEVQFQQVFEGQKAQGTITLLSAGQTFTGKIVYQSNEVDSSLGTIKLRAEVANHDDSLRPGTFSTVTVNGRLLDGVAKVPQRAVMRSDAGHFVYLMKDGKAQATPVKAGAWSGDRWVIESGLHDGDKVITSGLIKLRPGAPVTESTPDQATKAVDVMAVDAMAGASKKGAK
jgi:membrane fusion protein (multidrug efflux system)